MRSEARNCSIKGVYDIGMKAKILLGLLVLTAVSLACNIPVFATPGPPTTPTSPEIEATITSVVPPTGATNPPTSPADTVDVFLVKLEDAGQSGTPIGCNDSLVAVGTAVPAGNDPLVSAYSALFAIRDERVGPQGLYNALHASNLLVASATLNENGFAEIRLEGTYSLGGVCDNPRMVAQLEAAALQFPQVREVQIYLNGLPIEQALSGQ